MLNVEVLTGTLLLTHPAHIHIYIYVCPMNGGQSGTLFRGPRATMGPMNEGSLECLLSRSTHLEPMQVVRCRHSVARGWRQPTAGRDGSFGHQLLFKIREVQLQSASF